ncbi:LacI family DNA-binding transcriptional regulator [Demequina sp. SYSU T00192]|uniref:LacI family DNA-binding transcriptional regulator n=1 Tax=Demequina litoralis TaxID=3051660 RepID=A0ABT8GD14_9MICO|nr:LacI family DNA-binding transcriptional regulator [Demequina sp. SYSU T00192]MDN4476872.1 LacI family DNA-binding transcriptional regulator [Demequina sp. SYSU T00192]
MATLRDVAIAAGVSPATASRALSAPDTVSATRRTKVLEAAEQLGYQPNRSAQALASGRSRHLGLVVPDLSNPFFATVAKGVQAQARGTRNAVLVADTDEDPRIEHELVRDLQTSVDGLVLCSPRMPAALVQECATQGPIVLVNREVEGIPSVTFDVASGIRQALLHLRALRHRTVAYIGGPATSWSEAQRRTVLGEVEGIRVVDIGHHRPVYPAGFAATDLVLESGATAVLCYNDLVALGVMSRLRARGVRVPEDISVVGFDDIPTATYVTPMLTTVSLPLTRAGHEAVTMLDAALAEDGTTPTTAPLPVELVVRESTAPAHESP